MARTSCLTPIIVFGAVSALAVPAYGSGYNENIYVQQDTSTDNVSAGFDANLGDGGVENTAFGYFALEDNGCCGYYNSAFGYSALQNNTIGGYNTALGYSALWEVGDGSQNTAAGANAMFWSTGSNNTAVGYQTLAGKAEAATGSGNTAIGSFALYAYSTGSDNTASGYEALYANTAGYYNTADGVLALGKNTTGIENTASGLKALYSNTSGSNNIAEGFEAGYNLTTGSDNIDIGNQGVAGDGSTIRIGTSQTSTYIAGISGVKLTGNAVYVTSKGQLGVLASSERFKTSIAPMGSSTTKLGQLRPVTFHLKTDPEGALQYGLIAEEVAKVYPELVIRDESGRIDGVRYEELAPMLLNEVQQQQRKMAEQAEKNAAQEQHAAAQDVQISQLMGQLAEMHAALSKLQGKN